MHNMRCNTSPKRLMDHWGHFCCICCRPNTISTSPSYPIERDIRRS